MKTGLYKHMERYAWKAEIIPGKLGEYIERHKNISPELKQVLKSAGICNYTIWNVGNKLFGYYECQKGIKYAAKIQSTSDVVQKWNEYMKDILIMESDPELGSQPLLKNVFYLE